MRRFQKAVILALCLAAICLLAGCGVNHGSPEGVVKSLVKYSEKGKEKKILDCYGLGKDADDATKGEVQADIRYFETMKSKGIKLESCDVIEDFGDCTFVYISYKVKLDNKKEYPKIETYLTAKKDKDHCIIPTKDITPEMSARAEQAYTTFMTSDAYRDYQKAYDEFVLKNPSFEQELSLRLAREGAE